jgi:hypothetical protein
MAHFYGTLQGNRGGASRLGTKSSGLVTQTASWEGAVRVSVDYDKDTDRDLVHVSLIQWHNGAGVNRVLYSGPISGKEVQ